MPTYRKATPEERATYRAQLPRPVYPLAGFVIVAGVSCAVEDLGEWERGNPQYEIIAPAGQHFDIGETVHTLLCDNVKDVRDRAASAGLASCSCEGH